MSKLGWASLFLGLLGVERTVATTVGCCGLLPSPVRGGIRKLLEFTQFLYGKKMQAEFHQNELPTNNHVSKIRSQYVSAEERKHKIQTLRKKYFLCLTQNRTYFIFCSAYVL